MTAIPQLYLLTHANLCAVLSNPNVIRSLVPSFGHEAKRNAQWSLNLQPWDSNLAPYLCSKRGIMLVWCLPILSKMNICFIDLFIPRWRCQDFHKRQKWIALQQELVAFSLITLAGVTQYRVATIQFRKTISGCHNTTHNTISVWLNGWVFVYKLSGCGFESRWCHLNFRYGVCFEQGVPWHSGNCRFTLKLVRDMIITYSQFWLIVFPYLFVRKFSKLKQVWFSNFFSVKHIYFDVTLSINGS